MAIVVALGCARLSSSSLLLKPARRHPTCTSHGQTASGGASIDIALVALNCVSGTSASPGRTSAISAGVAPSGGAIGGKGVPSAKWEGP